MDLLQVKVGLSLYGPGVMNSFCEYKSKTIGFYDIVKMTRQNNNYLNSFLSVILV